MQVVKVFLWALLLLVVLTCVFSLYKVVSFLFWPVFFALIACCIIKCKKLL